MAASNIPSPEEALAGMARVGNPRVPMGISGFGFTAPTASPQQGSLVAKKGAQSGDPTPPGGVRAGGSYPLPAGRGDRNGAAYRITAHMPPTTSPEAGMTQANGRIVKPGWGVQAPNFGESIADTRA